MIIDGIQINSEKKIKIHNPHTNKVVGEVVNADEDLINLALEKSLKFSCNLSVTDKEKILTNTANYIEDNKSRFAQIITSESGLSLKDSLYEVGRVINCARYAVKCCAKVNSDISDNFIFDSDNTPKLNVIKEPLDLVIAITPFNHPMNQVAHKIFPGIIAGTAIVLKPSEKTPLSAIFLVNALIKNGLPKNMINVITGDNGKRIFESILSFPTIDMVTFTGGLEAGIEIKKMMVKKSHFLTKYVPELGGSSSLIICEDGNLDKAIQVILNGCFKNSGQRCTSIRRVIIDNKIAEKFIKKLVLEVKKIKYGDPYNEDNDMGTVIDEISATNIENRVNQAITDGATLLHGNKRLGAIYSPTVLDNVNLSMELVKKETFGPVCPIIRSNSFQESLEIAKETKYRLAGGIITNDSNKAAIASETLKVGQFSFNGPPSYRTEVAPFGGFGDSGNGEKEGILMAAFGMQRIRTFYSH